MKKSLLTLIMALVMALACATSAFAEDLGYVNVERVFRSYPDIQTTMSVINLERQKAENEFNEKAPKLDDKGRRELGEKLSAQVDKEGSIPAESYPRKNPQNYRPGSKSSWHC